MKYTHSNDSLRVLHCIYWSIYRLEGKVRIQCKVPVFLEQSAFAPWKVDLSSETEHRANWQQLEFFNVFCFGTVFLHKDQTRQLNQQKYERTLIGFTEHSNLLK